MWIGQKKNIDDPNNKSLMNYMMLTIYFKIDFTRTGAYHSSEAAL